MDALHCLAQGMGEGRGLDQSMRGSLGIDIKTFEGQWHQELEQRYASYIRKS